MRSQTKYNHRLFDSQYSSHWVMQFVDKYIHHFWLGFFFLWMIFTSGFLYSYTHSPGLLQSWQLRSLLSEKKTELVETENKVVKLKKQAEAFKTNSYVQELTIRRVLGYTAPNEIIFDFTSH